MAAPVTFRLPQGVEVVFDESHLAPVVAVQAWMKVGAGDEPPGQAGIAHLLEHMLFKGTERRGVGEIARDIEAAGGEINAWTSHDETTFHVVLPKAALPLGIDVLADILQNARFDPGEFLSERKVVLEEVRQGLDDPDRMAGVDLFAAAFTGHPYGRPVIGSAESVARLSRADLVRFFRRHYGARNLTLVVTGDFDPVATRRLVERAFAGMRPAQPCPPRPAEPGRAAAHVSAVRRAINESQLMLAWHAPGVADDDVVGLDLLAVALGQGESARLHLDLVRGRRLLHSASAYLFSGRDPGLFVVSGSLVGAGRAPAPVLRALLAQIERLCDEDLPEDEIARSRTLLESQRVFDRESMQGLARKLGFFASTVGDVHFEERYLRRLAELGPADLRRVARAHLRRDNLTVVAELEETRARRSGSPPPPSHARPDRPARAALAAVVRAFRSREQRASTQRPHSGAPAVETIRLASGIRLLVLPDPSLPLVALRAAWVGGLRHETHATNGASSLVAALLSRGTRNRDAESIMREVEGMAGSLSGHAGRNSLGLEAEFLSRHLDAGLTLFVDCLREPIFAPRELEHERRQAREALRQQEDDAATLAFRQFETTLYGDHPYGLDLTGNRTSLARLGRAELVRFFRNRYRPARLVLAAVGDVDARRLARRLDELFGAGRDAARVTAPAPAAAPRHPGPAFRFRALAREQAHLVLGFPGVTLGHRDRFALELLAQVLSGQGGRLFAELREKRGLVYSVGAFSMEGLDPGHFAVHAATSPETLATVLGCIRAELAAIREHGVGAAELRKAQRNLVGSHAIGLQRRSALAATMALHEAYGLGWQAFTRYAAEVGAVEVADLRRVAQKYWDPRREVVSVVGPASARAALEPRARRGATSSRAAAEAHTT